MLLKGRNGNEVELSFVRESLPDQQDGHGDSDWFTVIVRAATAEEEWEESSPCVNAYEFTNLAEWLEAVGRGAAEDVAEAAEVELLEPELKFAVTQQRGSDVGIRVGFHLVDRPEEFGVDDPTDHAEYVDLFMDREAVRSAAAALRASIEGFVRGDGKDDLAGEGGGGIMGAPDEDLNMVDGVEKSPPGGAGRKEDNTGER